MAARSGSSNGHPFGALLPVATSILPRRYRRTGRVTVSVSTTHRAHCTVLLKEGHG